MEAANIVFVEGSYPLDNALFSWESGGEHLRRLEDAGGGEVALEIVESVRDGLRRRLGATFTAGDLAELYGAGTDWARDLPGVDPARADVQDLVDAAFWLHLQNARDFAGGRRIDLEE